MSLLTIKERQTYLKELGYYTRDENGKEYKIDGIEGPGTKQAYKDLQKDYFTKSVRKKKDIDGIYGVDTDILLKNVYKCRNLKHFKVTEFKCKCKSYCTGYPVELDNDLLINLDKTRVYFNKTIKVTSGCRCKKHNSSLKGSSETSRHLKGKAVDVVVSSYKSLSKRKNVIDYWIKTFTESRKGYCDGYSRTKNSITSVNADNMVNSIHLDVI